MKDSLTFLRQYAPILRFGFLLTLFSSFGQTFFIALFNTDIRQQFGLSHGEFGTVYSLATLLSAGCLAWIGPKIDTTPLRTYTLWVCLGMIVAALIMGLAYQMPQLLVGIFLLRLTGQGLMGHISNTSMAKYFAERRGKALSMTALGHPVGEALLPLIGVSMIAALGWRGSWFAIAGIVAILLVPALLTSVRSLQQPASAAQQTVAPSAPTEKEPQLRQWSQKEVLHDSRFYMVLPALLTPALLLTGIFFHQLHLIDAKGWEVQWFAASYLIFSASTIVSSLWVGSFMHRVSELRILPFYLLPMGIGLACLSSTQHPIAIPVFMAGAGLSIGVAHLLFNSLWAAVYGTQHLGAIRAFTSAIMILSTAIAPILFGTVLDAGIPFDSLLQGSFLYLVGVAILATLAEKKYSAPFAREVLLGP
jgi:MFS family permease